MKILQTVSGTGLNGAIRHCLWLTGELPARGHRVTLLRRPGAWIAVQLTDAGRLAAALNLPAGDAERRSAMGSSAAGRVRRKFAAGRQIARIGSVPAEACGGH